MTKHLCANVYDFKNNLSKHIRVLEDGENGISGVLISA